MTLLSEGYQPRVLWQDTATPHPVATAELPGAVDVVVVGGGYAGLSAATELAAPRAVGGAARRPRPRVGRQHAQRRDGAARS